MKKIMTKDSIVDAEFGIRSFMKCPSPSDLLVFAFEGAGDLAGHLSSCERCRSEVARLRSLAAMLGTEAGTDHQHLDDVEVAVLVDGASPQALISRLSVCAECRNRVMSVGHALRTLDIELEPAPPLVLDGVRSTGNRKFWVAGSAMAAVAAAVALLVAPVPQEEPIVHRDVGFTQIAPAMLQNPEFERGMLFRLSWSAVPTAGRYEVVVYDSTGEVLVDHFTSDTVFDIRQDSLAADGSLYWLVRAQLEIGRWVISDLTRIGWEPTQ